MLKTTLTAALLASAATAAAANEFAPAMQSYLEREILPWATSPVILSAIRAQNAQTGTLSQADIDALDQAWRAEVGQSERPTIAPVLSHEASDFLRERISAAGGVITEVFVMDARGLNVATSDVTSDFWQGDEAKFTETFSAGAGAMHFGEVEFDESTQTFQGQISISLADPATNEVLGAMTVGVNAEALF